MKWQHRPEAGGRFAIWLIRETARVFGRGFVRPFLYPISLYFYLRRVPERRVSKAYLARIAPAQANALGVLKHIHAFASTILDRMFFLLQGFKPFEIVLHGFDQLQQQIERGRGVLLLGAHVGSFELLRAFKHGNTGVVLKVVMDQQQTHALNSLLYALNPDFAEQIIEAGADPIGLALALRDVAAQGGVIGLLGDRSRPGELTVDAEFLGERATFPAAPYLIASALEMPVVLGVGLYRGRNRYELYFETLGESIKIPRNARAAALQNWAQRYAARLEHYVRMAPFNWFNFYDFWHCPADEPRARGDADRAVA
ncbi:MAG: acyltransferase [Gammaproteobacteria bacterium]|nr:MAG: acyltransferase [Gammaproteobacteria bacterium]